MQDDIKIPEIPNADAKGVNKMVYSDEKITDEKFDAKKIFDEEIRPLFEKLVNVCGQNKIPFMCGINFCNDDDGAGICFASGLPGARTPVSFRAITEIMQDRTGNTLRGLFVGLAALHALSPSDSAKDKTEN